MSRPSTIQSQNPSIVKLDLDSILRAARSGEKVFAVQYLRGDSRAQGIVVIEAVSVPAAALLAKLKKGPLAKAAEQQLANAGWLPAILRTAQS